MMYGSNGDTGVATLTLTKKEKDQFEKGVPILKRSEDCHGKFQIEVRLIRGKTAKAIKNPKVGDVVVFKSVSWSNEHGGTEMDNRGTLSFRATITKRWFDYETGMRYWADLEEDVEVISCFDQEHETLKKGTKVYVGQFDIKEEA